MGVVSHRIWPRPRYPRQFPFDDNQLSTVSTDDFAGALANQTNLALKAILGIRAMADIATVTDHPRDAEEFLNVSEKYMSKWEKYAFEENGTHAKLAYQLPDTWGLIPFVL